MFDHEIKDEERKEILVVDDTPASLQLLSNILTSHGYRVRPASDGELALRAVAAGMPDLILLDVIMPSMDGFEVCRRLKAEDKSREVPVIFISTPGETTKKVEGFDAGGVDFITRPFEPEEVLARVRTHLALRRMQRELEAKDIVLQQEIVVREQTEEELREHKAHLEDIVAEHTNGLRKINEELQQEIAERIQAEEALRESEERYRSVIENIQDVVYRSDLDGNLIMASPSLAQIFGYDSLRECLGKGIATQFYFEPEKRAELLAAISTQGYVKDYELILKRRDGTPVVVSISSHLYYNREGNVAGVEGVFHDITERKQAEKALQESEERYRSLLENIELGIALVDPSYRIVMTNAAAGRLLNKPASELVGRKCYREFEKRDAVCLHCPGAKAMATGSAHEVVTEGVRDDGSRFTAYLHAFPTYGRDGAAMGFVEVIEDITRHKEAEEELNRYRDHLEELVRERTAELIVAKTQAETANKAKSVFLANMSHELRTPLNAILGYAQILKRDPTLNDRQTAAVKTIQQSGEFLLTLINDILNLSKIESGKLELHSAETDLAAFLRSISDIIRVKADQKSLLVAFETSPDLPRAVLVDEERLCQILLNLLGNALRFTNTGQVTLRVSCFELQYSSEEPATCSPAHTPGNPKLEARSPLPTARIRFEVEDTGIGVPPEQLERIFLPFEQVCEVRRKTGGVGLGLAISRRLVRLMGGEIQVRSEAGKGSAFWFELSLPVTKTAVIAARPAERIVTGYEGPRQRLLIVDDIAESRAMMADLLAPLGFEISEAASGEESLAKARDTNPHLILMDILMPGMDGLEAARRIRKIPGLEETSIIAVSAGASSQDQARSLEADANGFILKPIHLDVLLKEIGKQLKLSWIHERPGARSDTGPASKLEAYTPFSPSVRLSSPDASLALPPPEELKLLYDLAVLGKVRQIREHAARLESMNERYKSFADRLIELANAFEIKQIKTFIEQRMEEDR